MASNSRLRIQSPTVESMPLTLRPSSRNGPAAFVRLLGLVVLAISVASTSPCRAQTKRDDTIGPGFLPPVKLPENAVRFGWVDGVVTGGFAALALTSAIIGPREGGPTGGIWFDEGVRDALRAEDDRTALAFKDASDVLLTLTLSTAFLGDALVNAAWLRRSPEVGREIGLVNVEVLAITLGVQQLTADLVGRERPYGRTCGTEELSADSAHCTTNDRYLSHYSAHTSLSFSMAAASCVQHASLGLSRYPAAWCGVQFSLATATGLFRIVSDQHYATDVLVGAASGAFIGTMVPLIHLGFFSPSPSKNTESLATLQLLPTGNGFMLRGTFQ